tara:strand:- start:431 stop:622 length:192 start_codon:yes stop_codon:yes gene_type:complete
MRAFLRCRHGNRQRDCTADAPSRQLGLPESLNAAIAEEIVSDSDPFGLMPSGSFFYASIFYAS